MELLIGTFVSIVTELVTRYFKAGTTGSLLAFLAISVVASAGYFFAAQTEFFPSLLQIASYASLIFGLFIHPANKGAEGR